MRWALGVDGDGVADGDVAVSQDVRIQTRTVHEALEHAGLRHRLQMRARSTLWGTSPCVSVRKIPSTRPSGTNETLATEPAAARGLDGDQVARCEVEGHLPGERLAVEEVPPRHSRVAAALSPGRVAP